VQLNEDAQLRVLAGQTTYVSEAKKKKDEEVKEEMKAGDKKPSSTGGTIEKTATGVKHHAGKNYGGSKAEVDSDDEDDKKAKKKAKKESIEPEFKSKFMKMVEAKKDEADKKKADKKKKMEEGSKPDFLDLDKDGNKKEPMKSAADDKKKNPFTKKKVGEATVNELSPDTLKSYKEKNVDSGRLALIKRDKETHAKRSKGFDDVNKRLNKANKNETVYNNKQVVAESYDTKLTFRDMVQLVQESGGQQQIDPVDKALFTWAERVAKNKLGEGMKADLYAGLVYERNGGVFEMYDVLSESKKKVVESRSQLDEGIMDKIKSFAVPKLMKLLGPDAEDIANAVKQATGGDLTANKENAIKVVQALGIDKAASKDKSSEMAEAIAGNWQGKLIQSLYTLGLLGSAGAAASMWGTVGGSFMAIIGTLLIMFAATFFDDDRGMVGAMGKRGNQGFDTNK
jgi:hypothetical protein